MFKTTSTTRRISRSRGRRRRRRSSDSKKEKRPKELISTSDLMQVFAPTPIKPPRRRRRSQTLSFKIIFLIIKMASVILLHNQSARATMTTTTSSSSHLPSATHQHTQNSNEISSLALEFEWPRVSANKSGGGGRKINNTIVVASGVNNNNNNLYDIERLHKPNSQVVGLINDQRNGQVDEAEEEEDNKVTTRINERVDSDVAELIDYSNGPLAATTLRPAAAVNYVGNKYQHLNHSSAVGSSNKSPRSIHNSANIYIKTDRLKFSTSSNQLVSVPAGRGHYVASGAESKRTHEHDPDCALILKRTYILKPSESRSGGGGGGGDEWGDKFVFNDVDPDDEAAAAAAASKRRVHKSDLCIKRSDVDKAVEEARHRIKFEQPGDLNSFEVGERSLASIGELNLATGLLLTKRFDLSHDEIINALPMIDMSASQNYWNDLCPKHVRPMMCMKTRYRTLSAHCNNLKHPSWGASKTPYSRYLPPDYADGLSAPRAARSGEPLPSARLITSIVHQDHDEPSHDYSILFADWGQLLNHDVTRVAVGEAPDCCPQLLKGLCMPIPVPPNDPLYSKHNVKCLKFERSLAAIRPKCLLGHRAQINLVTSPVDASFVYGSTKEHATRLRSFSEGKMKVMAYFGPKLKPLLPAKTEDPDKDCVARPKHLFCFDAGDVRVNEQTHLTVLHTIYLREHNRIAKQLAKMNMEWDDDKLYHETRHIVAACVQHVMVNEFLPLLLGKHHVSEFKIGPSEAKDAAGGGGGAGFWPGYDPSVTISTGTAFAAAAYRYGHSMIEGVIRRLDAKSGHHVKSELLRFLFKRPFWLYEPGAVDQLLAGMLLTPAEQTDPYVSEELSGHLFQPPKAKFGHDLAAINIQRGRDQGVPGYNEWREWCGLKRAKSFGDLEPLLMNHTAWQYSKIYKHVDDIDLWSAGISERKLHGSAVGPTMACIIARQFLNFKRGDRFWYENPGELSSFTPNQLREIKKMTLAKILCTNSDDLERIQPWAMRLPHPIYNAKVPCESLPTMNLKYWDSSLMDNFD